MTDLTFSTLDLGPPGTGKSWFLGTVAKYVQEKRKLKVALLTLLPQEGDSFGYAGLDNEVFFDPEFVPEIGLRKATAYKEFLKRLAKLYADDSIGAVLVDPLTEIGTLASNEVLSWSADATTPKSTGDSRGYYGEVKYKQQRAVDLLTGLTKAKVPKIVAAAGHVQEASDEERKSIEFEGMTLPMLEGGYRTKMANRFNIICYSHIVTGFDRKRTPAKWVEYKINVRPTSQEQAKTNICPLLDVEDIPNDFAELMRVVEKARKVK